MNRTNIVEKRSEEAKVALGISNYTAGPIWSCLTTLTHTHAPKHTHFQFGNDNLACTYKKYTLLEQICTSTHTYMCVRQSGASTDICARASVGARVHRRLHVRVWKRLCTMDPAHTRVCVCVWLGFKIVSRACVINVPEREGPKDISQAEGEQRKCSGEGRGAERRIDWWGKKRGGCWVGGDWFLLGPAMFPIM